MYNKLVSLKYDLEKYHRNKKELDKYYITKRLNESLNSYYDELQYSLKYLNNRQPENVIKKLGD